MCVITYVVSVVNSDPSEPPARNQPPFGQPTARQDWNCPGERCHRDVVFLGALEHKVLVDLIGNNGEIVLLSYLENVQQVVPVKHRSARIRGVVDQNGLGFARLDQRLQVLEVDLPTLLRQEVVLLRLDAKAVGKSLVQGKS